MATRLAQWGRDGERPETAMAWMHTPVPFQFMPGLATPEQLDALRAARGADADALFLDLMAEHHRGAPTWRPTPPSTPRTLRCGRSPP